MISPVSGGILVAGSTPLRRKTPCTPTRERTLSAHPKQARFWRHQSSKPRPLPTGNPLGSPCRLPLDSAWSARSPSGGSAACPAPNRIVCNGGKPEPGAARRTTTYRTVPRGPDRAVCPARSAVAPVSPRHNAENRAPRYAADLCGRSCPLSFGLSGVDSPACVVWCYGVCSARAPSPIARGQGWRGLFAPLRKLWPLVRLIV